MVKKIGQGIYKIGRIEHGESFKRGTYGVATGKALNNRDHVGHKMIDFLPRSKWFTYRFGTIDKIGGESCCHLLGKFDSKKKK